MYTVDNQSEIFGPKNWGAQWDISRGYSQFGTIFREIYPGPVVYIFILASFILLAAMLGAIIFQEGPLNFMAEQAYHSYHLVDPSPWPLGLWVIFDYAGRGNVFSL